MIEIFVDASGVSLKRPARCPTSSIAMMVFNDTKCIYWQRINVPKITDSNIAEMYAIIMARQYILNTKLSNEEFCIYSDSRSAIRTMRFKYFWTYRQLSKSSEKEDFRFRCVHLLAKNSIIWEETCRSRKYL